MEYNKPDLPPWLDRPSTLLEGMIARGTLPQALLIHGLPGTGRESLAVWLTARLLNTPVARFRDALAAEVDELIGRPLAHPDFFVLEPPPDKVQVGIVQVRQLIDFLNLRSHAGGPRVGLVRAADALTLESANGLLKTLEEPHPGSHLVLIARQASGLPATVLSRCQRLAVHAPSIEDGVSWLRDCAGEGPWQELLDFAGGAPLRALELHEAGFAERAAEYAVDLAAVMARRMSPTAAARRWEAGEPGMALLWVQRRAHHYMRELVLKGTSASLQSTGEGDKIRLLTQALQPVELLRRRGVKALRVELQLAMVLETWQALGPVPR
jgi:DNA polymerase-3 subunit delta'